MTYLDAGDFTPDQLRDRTPIEGAPVTNGDSDEMPESDRAICGMCGGKGCFDCLDEGTERTREDFIRHAAEDEDGE